MISIGLQRALGAFISNNMTRGNIKLVDRRLSIYMMYQISATLGWGVQIPYNYNCSIYNYNYV